MLTNNSCIFFTGPIWSPQCPFSRDASAQSWGTKIEKETERLFFLGGKKFISIMFPAHSKVLTASLLCVFWSRSHMTHFHCNVSCCDQENSLCLMYNWTHQTLYIKIACHHPSATSLPVFRRAVAFKMMHLLNLIYLHFILFHVNGYYGSKTVFDG